MRNKFIHLFWQNVSVRNEIVLFCAKFLLGSDVVEAETILASDLETHREMVYPLELVQLLVVEVLVA